MIIQVRAVIINITVIIQSTEVIVNVMLLSNCFYKRFYGL
uniref:Uncharacterized protein n=1 Tax=Arundo donax TaxID=35708 RepID=A0A0A9CS39_ARUDO